MIDLLPTPEQQQIVDSVAEYLSSSLPVSRLRPGGGAGVVLSDEQWRDIAALGWFGLGVPGDLGGIGYTCAEEVLVAREIGRHVASPALVATMLAAHVAVHAECPGLYERIAAGECRVGLGKALPGGDEYHLIDAAQAELVLVWSAQGTALYERAAFTAVEAVSPFDEAVQLQRGCLPGSAQAVASVSAAQQPLPLHAALLVAGQLVGVAEAARDLTVEYAKVRQQFGQAIGSFQSIKHRCADMATAAEAAYAQTCFAALALQSGQADAAFQVSVAVVLSTDSALANARSGIQVHGGIGFTAECDAHRFLKRSHLLEQLGGARSSHRAVLLAQGGVQ
jgi:alkylation response protein AidB-like acyl-CoA dehydrogenase